MARKLEGPGGAYSVRIEAYISRGAGQASRHETDQGLPCSGIVVENGRSRPCLEEPAGECTSFLVRLGPALSFMLDLLDAGMIVKEGCLTGSGRATVTATVEAGPGAPASLPGESSYVLFNGDGAAIADEGSRYFAFPGAGGGDGQTADRSVGVDMLVQALGRAVARANAVLAVQQGAGGTALVTGLTVRVGVAEFDVAARDRVVLTLPAQGEQASQYVEVNLKTAPSETPADGAGGAPGGGAAAAPGGAASGSGGPAGAPAATAPASGTGILMGLPGFGTLGGGSGPFSPL